MSASHATSHTTTPPGCLGLLTIGIGRLRDMRAYWWFFALTITLSLLTEFLRHGGLVSGLASFGLGLVNLYAWFVLARQLMTGTLAPARFDVSNVGLAIVLGTALAAVAAVALVAVLAALDQSSAVPLALAVMAPPFFYLLCRTAFYVPALAVNDRTSMRLSFRQGGPYWKRLAVLAVVVGGGGWLIDLIVARAALPWPVQPLLHGGVEAAGTILVLAPACYLYWTYVRPAGRAGSI